MKPNSNRKEEEVSLLYASQEQGKSESKKRETNVLCAKGHTMRLHEGYDVHEDSDGCRPKSYEKLVVCDCCMLHVPSRVDFYSCDCSSYCRHCVEKKNCVATFKKKESQPWNTSIATPSSCDSVHCYYCQLMQILKIRSQGFPDDGKTAPQFHCTYEECQCCFLMGVFDCLSGLSFGVVGPVITWSDVARQYNLEESSLPAMACCAFFCRPCVITRLHKEMASRGHNPGQVIPCGKPAPSQPPRPPVPSTKEIY